MEFYCFGIPEPLDTADSAAARDFFDYNENPREDSAERKQQSRL